MEKFSPSQFFDKNSARQPVVRLLKGSKDDLCSYAISMSADVDAGCVSLKIPVGYMFRFCDGLLKQFIYNGLSFDELVIDPKYAQSQSTALVNNVVVTISVRDNMNDNRLLIKFKR
jgi:hypothetical protein